MENFINENSEKSFLGQFFYLDQDNIKLIL